MEEVGTVSHYFTGIGVAIVNLNGPLNIGDKVKIIGATTDFEQTIESMQIENKDIEHAKIGDSIGLKVNSRVRKNDILYKIT